MKKRRRPTVLAAALVTLWLGPPGFLAFDYRFHLYDAFVAPSYGQLPLNRHVPASFFWRGQEYQHEGSDTESSLRRNGAWPLEPSATAFAPGSKRYVGYVPKGAMTPSGPTQYIVWLRQGARYHAYDLQP
jgi:hypothetical protein